jgi:hypothetical protein
MSSSLASPSSSSSSASSSSPSSSSSSSNPPSSTSIPPYSESVRYRTLHGLLSIPSLCYLWLGRCLSSNGSDSIADSKARLAVCICVRSLTPVKELLLKAAGEDSHDLTLAVTPVTVTPYGLCTLHMHSPDYSGPVISPLDAIKVIRAGLLT